MSSDVLQAILLGLLYWFAWSKIGYSFQHFMRQPITLSIPIGIIMGNLHDAVIIGATMELLYMGIIAPGANIPADEGLAACVAIPIALKTHMTPEMAVALAVPLGVMGIFIDQVRRTLNAFFVHLADKYAEDANTAGIYRCAGLWPLLLQLPLRVAPVFLAALYGADAVSSFMKIVPRWIIHGVEITGGVLPGLGFALTIMVIGRRSLLPYFLIGFFLVKYASINIMSAAIFGTCVAFLHVHLQGKNNKGGDLF
ncbi:MAG: PTS sugar transporter subunit IIC [Negativicutes bacterium]|nr:PTS sugar transporter subunit IIC [Negativicutes bacterium]